MAAGGRFVSFEGCGGKGGVVFGRSEATLLSVAAGGVRLG
jgi:hypothetical protein